MFAVTIICPVLIISPFEVNQILTVACVEFYSQLYSLYFNIHCQVFCRQHSTHNRAENSSHRCVIMVLLWHSNWSGNYLCYSPYSEYDDGVCRNTVGIVIVLNQHVIENAITFVDKSFLLIKVVADAMFSIAFISFIHLYHSRCKWMHSWN